MMYPYIYMDPYPQHFSLQRDQNPYPYHQYPIWETVPPFMRVDPSKSPSASGPCPCNGPFSHPNPAEHHSCCNYSYPPGYYNFRPPYSHILPPPQPYYHCPYPSYPDSNPAFIPPPYYSVDRARYDYDKNKDHCCGCPNHTCHRNEGSNVKIEEQKPETEPKESDSSGLIRLPNYPCPVIWFPPRQMEEEERANHMKDDKSNSNSVSHPGFWNGWAPLDMNSLKGLQQGGEVKKIQHGEEKKMQLPWPIICMPGYDKLEDSVKDLKEINAGPKSVEELPSKFKITPLKLLENENCGEKPETAEDEPKIKARPEAVAEKGSKIKTIAVKPMEEKNDTKHNMHVKEKEKGEEKKTSVHEKEEVGAKKDSDSKPTSPKRSSKMPPVCLRVDPLPKKKTSNGISHSPSSPGRKEEKSHQDNKEQVPNSKETKEESPNKAIRVAIRVVDIGKSSKPETVPVLSLKRTTGQPGEEKEGKGEGKQEVDMVVGAAQSPESKPVEVRPVEEGIDIKEEHEIEKKDTFASSEIEEGGETKERQRVLSESDAAVLIQSTYRGWEVRRWQPLEKLRKIARIREKVTDVKRQMEDLEASSEHEDTKERVVINETIMSLLLQLDTIQGLHPNVREIRKFVTRDLIALQEKLDSLGSRDTRENKPAEVEKNMSDKTSNDESHSVVSSSPVDLAPEEGSVQPAAADGVAMQPSFEVKEESDDDQKRHEQISQGENEALETKSEQPVQQLPLLKAEKLSSGCEEHKEAALVKEENLASEVAGEEPHTAEVASEVAGEEPPTAEDSSEPSVFASEETVVLSSGYMTPILGMQELPAPKDVTSLPSKVVEGVVADAGTGQNEEVELELEKSLETSFDECSNQEEKPSVLSPEEANKLKEAAVTAKAEQVPKSIVEESVEVPVGKNDGLIVTPLVQIEDADTCQELQLSEDNFHAQDTPGDVDIDNSSSSDASFPEPTMEVDDAEGPGEEKSETAAIMAETIEANNPVTVADRDLITGVLESGEDKAASLEAVGGNSETSLELAMDEVETPATKEPGVAADQEEDAPAQPLMVATVDNNPQPDLVTGSLSAVEMSSDEKKVMENEKLREMLVQLLEAGKQQLGIISDLNGRVKELEKKLSQKKRVRARRNKLGRGSLCN